MKGEQKFKIFYRELTEDGNEIGEVKVFPREYKYYGTALNVAKREFGPRYHNKNYNYEVSILNPFEDHFDEVVCELCGMKHLVRVTPTFVYQRNNYISLLEWGSDKQHHIRINNVCPECMSKIVDFVDGMRVVKEEE